MRTSTAGGPALVSGATISVRRNSSTVTASKPPPTSRLVIACQSSEVITSVSVKESITPKVAANQPTTSHGPTRPNTRSKRCSSVYATGMINSVSTVEVIKPPMTTMANGGHISFSRPVVMASGHSAAMVVAEVINTGRVRSRTAASAAAPGDQPPRTRWAMRSTNRMAGFTAKPNNMMMPAPAMIDAGVPVNTNSQAEPSTASGSASSTNTGKVSDSNAIASTSASSSSAGTANWRIMESVSSSSRTSTV